jgi:threonine dehydratase
LIERYVDDVVVVTEDSVAAAMALLLERSKLCVEGAGAVGVAAILSGQVVPSPSGTTCVVLSGGNVDLGPLAGLIRLHETTAGRRAILCTRLEDRPGSLAGLLSLVGQQSANVLDVMHVRDGVGLHAREASIRLVIELKDGSHASRLLDALREENFDAWWISDDERT